MIFKESSQLSRSANLFAVDLFQSYLRRHGDKYKNLLLCPYLIYHSLAMMLAGAKGETANQLCKLLRLTNATKHREFLLLTEQLIHGNHDFVHLASFIYLDKSAKRNERYKTILKDFYETKPKKIDFDNVDLMVKTINEDVARTTENIYNDILSKQEAQQLEKSYMLLVNAVFFRGFWLSNFTDVKKAPFTRASNQLSAGSKRVSSITSLSSTQCNNLSCNAARQPHLSQQLATNALGHPIVNMMSKLDYLPIVDDDQLEARIVRLPFEASDLQMLLILPNDKQSDSSYLCDKITAKRIESIADQFARSKCRTVRVSMPIFCIDSGKISLQSTLVNMGAGDLFNRTKANMSGLCENKPVWLHKIIHRCFMICDNRGAITSSSFEKAKRRQAKFESGITSGRSGVDDFVADHPFMYIIMDSVTKTILLIGLYTDPSETLEVIHENQLSSEEAHQIYTEGVYKT